MKRPLRSPSELPESHLVQRVEALEELVNLGAGLLPIETVASLEGTASQARQRLAHGTDFTVVAIGGATGSGKSSIVNRLAGETLTASSVRRPTTSSTHAVVWGEADASPLLDWLEVEQRFYRPSGGSFDGLILLDLPDHDSTAVEHRLEVDRLVELVDVLIWVTDPQKYADEALHARYVAPLAATHPQIMRFVLNQIDRLPDGHRAVQADLTALLEASGLRKPEVIAISAETGAGFDALADLFIEAIAQREASLVRLDADISNAAELVTIDGHDAATKAARKRLVEGFGEAAGSHVASDVARRHHQRQGNLTMGWPFTRPLRRLSRKPLKDLPGPGRTSSATPRVDLAIRDYADELTVSMQAPWPSRVRERAMFGRERVIEDLRSAVGRAATQAGEKPRWWSLIAWLQRLFAVLAVVGVIWLITVAILGGFFHFDTDPLLPVTPRAEWIPIPTTLALGGIIIGAVLALIVKLPLAVGANRRARQAKKDIEDRLSAVADEQVVEPVAELMETLDRLRELAATAR